MLKGEENLYMYTCVCVCVYLTCSHNSMSLTYKTGCTDLVVGCIHVIIL